ncbi:MAG TPA: M48 family metallopeptidase [Bacteroidales bacterium]|nr:M48 family metallopeptidase [Bacteroidales bacterium]
MKVKILLVMICSSMLLFTACNKDEGVNFFSLQQDKDFGKQMSDEIAANPTEYPILNATQYPAVYAKIASIRDKILASGELNHKDDFTWEIKIINKPVLNAFATPGGYIYVYTGLMKYLDNEAQLAGVLGHEMAHADLRHSTKQLTKQYGFSILLSALLGNSPGKVAEIAAGLAQGLSGLAFSREDEYKADEYSVKYLLKTDYDPKGVQGFFQKMINDNGSSGTPAFLSTHPADKDRIDNITKIWQDNGSKTGQTYASEYATFKTTLP